MTSHQPVRKPVRPSSATEVARMMHKYKDVDGEFLARIICVEPEGKLILEDEKQVRRAYMFKEVEYLLR